jgi:hypothetical protein
MMTKAVLACLFLAAVVTAIPSADNVVAGTEFVEAPDDAVHEEAAGEISALLESGKTKDACASLADSTIKQVSDSIASAQKLANAVPKGAACKKEGQPTVDKAKKNLDSAKTKAADAKKASNSAKSKPVKFKDVTIADIKDGDCAAFFQDPAYTAAQKGAEAAAKADAKAAGEFKAAQTAYDDALAAQKKAIHICACDAQKKHGEAKKAIDKANSAENAKAWTKGHHMKCVLDGKNGANCKVPAVPKSTLPGLKEPAKSAQCGHFHHAGDTVKVYVLTGSKSSSETGNKPTVRLHGSSGKTYATRFHPGKKGKSTTVSMTPPKGVTLGSIESVSFDAHGTDGWLIQQVKVDGRSYSKVVAGHVAKGLPFWLDGKPYGKSYNGYGFGDKVTLSM